MLRVCGWATDPQYGPKIIALINSCGLRKYDEEAAEGDDDKLKLTDSQTTMLVSALKKLVTAGTIGAEWVTKAEKGTLTISELAWLNTIVLARK